jgi:hypothetical protein
VGLHIGKGHGGREGACSSLILSGSLTLSRTPWMLDCCLVLDAWGLQSFLPGQILNCHKETNGRECFLRIVLGKASDVVRAGPESDYFVHLLWSALVHRQSTI